MAGASSPWPWGWGLRNWLASLLLCVSPEMPPGGHVRSSNIWRVIQTVDAGCTKPVWAYVSSQFLVERAGWSACRVSLNLTRRIGLRLEVSMRRKFGQLLLAGCLLVIPAVAQRGGGGH